MARPRSQSAKRSTSAKRGTSTSAKRGTSTSAKRGTSTSARRGTSTSAKQSTQFKCPECGQTFGRASALGSHRKNSHGVVGASSRTKTRQRAATTTGTRRRGRPAITAARSTNATGTRRRGRPPGSQNRPKTGTVNRDALLQALFPGGIPANEDTIRSLNAWLDEAERIASSR
jgi:predicted RNA-binding Zn-ribbon protein involved in translation (DUF1610 family)